MTTPRWLIPLVIIASVFIAAPAAAERELFFEETAESFWGVPHLCEDGSTVTATLLVRTTRDFEAPETEDPFPTARVQFQAVCPDGTSFSWVAAGVPATITGTENLKSVTASGAGTARDLFDQLHQVSFEASWTGVGPVETTVNTERSIRKQREATATGQVTFDGAVHVNGPNNHPTRPAPFIRNDLEL
ncbi:MAG TPA: hypothetical protein VF062_26850 [Candidatus Limnocylindrales bacterium]